MLYIYEKEDRKLNLIAVGRSGDRSSRGDNYERQNGHNKKELTTTGESKMEGGRSWCRADRQLGVKEGVL
jgi:hypothetical protein